jgi:glutathione synthase/RimK-type ligase-like ATP-grasp enzyme
MNIGVFFEGEELLGFPLDHPLFKDLYFSLFKDLFKLKVNLYLIRGRKQYLGNSIFKEAYLFDGNKSFIKKNQVKIDLLYDKGDCWGFLDLNDGKINIFNHPKIIEICTDKWKTYEYFGEFCPKTYLVEQKENLEEALERIKTKLKVIKPLNLGGGKGIKIGLKKDLLPEKYEYPLLVQEFFDTSAGIPNITESYHDFRVYVVSGKPMLVLLRTPQEGSLIANVSLGGTQKYFDPQVIPKEAMEIIDYVDFEFSQYGERFYSIDLAYSNNKWKIIEINARPGMSKKLGAKDVFKKLRKALVETLVQKVKRSK